MVKKLVNIVDCVFVGNVFGGQWIGLDEVKVEEIVEKQIVPNNKFITDKFCTFYYKGNKYISQVTRRPSWIFSS